MLIGSRPGRIDISVRLRKSAVQSIPTGANTALTFDIQDYDTHSFHSAGSQMVIPLTRKYAVVGGGNFDVNAVGIRRLFIRLNAVTVLGIVTVNAVGVAGVGTTFQVVEDRLFAAGDILELVAFQTSGGPLNITTPSTFFAAHAR